MKLAISGKGGVGKSTIAGAIALLLARRGGSVLALDADPDANLASALGIPDDIQNEIVPISRQVELIEERTGAKVKQYGQMFKLNPEVSDIAGKYATNYNGAALLVLGAVKRGGGGCACPESVLIRALVNDLVLHKNDALVMDMEAGIEHLGRATSKGVDRMVVVVEPGRRSFDCAEKVVRMAGEIGIATTAFIANKVTCPEDEKFIRENLPEDAELLGIIPYTEAIRTADQHGGSIIENLDSSTLRIFEKILAKLT